VVSMSPLDAQRIAAEMLAKKPKMPEYDPDFIRVSHAVARGEMTVDQAWAELQRCRARAEEPQ